MAATCMQLCGSFNKHLKQEMDSNCSKGADKKMIVTSDLPGISAGWLKISPVKRLQD